MNPRSTNYKDALKYGFYELQTTRDWYREVTSDIGMHADLVRYWIRISALLITPIAPHFAEHIWTSILGEPKSIQHALWPTPTSPVDKPILDAGAYMRETVKTIRDAEVALLKKISKAKGGPALFDPKQPRAVRVYVSTKFPEWQNVCLQAVKEAWDAEREKVDDVRVREILTAQGLIKEKRAMPFVQLLKVSFCPSASQSPLTKFL